MSENTKVMRAKDLAGALRARTVGPVHTPGDEGHEKGRTGIQLMDRHEPDAVVEAATAEDVRAAVTVAAAHGVPVAAQRTGHGHGVGMDEGILVDTRRLSGVRIDPERRTARVEAGATWRDVIEAASPHGLAPLSGSSPDVGVVSYLLGGGLSLLGRRHGYAADHVRSLDLVTPDGEHTRVDEHTGPETFWALRGGGSSFGLVTGVEFDLFPVARLYGGGLYLDATDTPDILDLWRRWADDTPEEMTSGVSALRYPDMEGVPDHLRGRPIVQISAAWSGPPERGPALLAPLRSAAPVLMDTLRELPYADSGAVFDDHDDRAGFRGEGLMVRDPGPEALTALLRTVLADRPFMRVVWLRHLGGAMARPPRTPSAVGHRDASHALSALTFTGPDGVDTAAMADLRSEVAGLFADHALGTSSNLSFGPVEAERVRSMYEPATLRRLVELRDRMDPHRRIHTNRPLPPTV
ncbi:FAD-binding oxidoreductase [Nocardiopsis alba]|uniref:FAD-binding oxidoreductase n=1 Tax=Nocardiopsis alba TaxID=53437 RepID=UPI0005AA6862|nr:FAD-binding oxidoreductase [Nocardiopsis alba]